MSKYPVTIDAARQALQYLDSADTIIEQLCRDAVNAQRGGA